jgi:anti-anti-sigma factor
MRTDFQYTCAPPRARLRVVGELDASTNDRLCDVLDCLHFRRCNQVEVDLAAVTFIDASSLRVLHTEQRRLLVDGGSLEVVAASKCHQLVARLAQYDGLLAPERGAAGGGRPQLTMLQDRPPLRLQPDPAS